MPVINLPKDTRWGDIGTNLGAGIAQVLEAYGKKKAETDIQQMIADPSVAEADYIKEAFKRQGTQGIDILKKQLAAQVLVETVAEKKAAAAKDQSTIDRMNAYIKLLTGGAGGGGTGAVTPPAATGTLPTGAPSAPAVTSSVADVLAPKGAPSGASTSAPTAPTSGPTASTTSAPSAAQPASPVIEALTPSITPAPTAPTSSTTPTSPPVSNGSLLEQTVDNRVRAAGIAVTPGERQVLIKEELANLTRPSGGQALGAPTDGFIKLKQGGAKHQYEVSSAQSGAQTAAAGAATAEAKAKVDLAKADQELADLQATAPYKGRQASANLRRTEQETAANAPAQISVEEIKKSFPTFSEAQAAAASTAAAEGGSKAYVEQVGKAIAQNAGSAVGESTAKFLRETASYGAITERFMRELAAAPDKLGFFSVSGIKARLEERGVPIGDPGLVNLLTSQKIAVAEQARQSGQFGVSATNLRLSKDTAANIDKTALSNVMLFAGAAAQKLKEAEVEKALYTDNPRALAAIDAAMQPWKNIQAMTDTLTSYVDTKELIPGKKERDVMYFMGNQVSPNTMAPIVKQDSTVYKVKPQGADKKTSYTGVELWALATKAGIDPAAMLVQMGGKL